MKNALSSEVWFAQKLAANEKHIRDKAVRKLQKWIAAKTSSTSTGFTKFETLKIWKGLFYSMWMSDKPVVQEELAATISNLIHAFGNTKSALLFIGCFFQTMNREWQGIDTWRMDKYMNFVRKFLSQCFEFLGRFQWQQEVVDQFLETLSNDIVNCSSETVSIGLQMHVADIYIEELAKSAHSKLAPERLTDFFVPYCHCLASKKQCALTKTIVTRVFEFALRLHEEESDREDDDDENDGEEEVVEVANDSDDGKGGEGEISDEEDLGLTGNWRRTLKKHEMEARSVPFPKFDFQNIGDTIDKIANDPKSKLNQGLLKHLASLFWKMAKGVFDLDHVKVPEVDRLRAKDYEEAAQRLAYEDEIYRQERKRLKLDNFITKKIMHDDADSDDDAMDMVDEDDLNKDFDYDNVRKTKKSSKKSEEPFKKTKQKVAKKVIETGEKKVVDQQQEPVMDKLMLRLLAKGAEVKLATKKKEKVTKLKKKTQALETKSKPKTNVSHSTESDLDEQIPALIPIVADVNAEIVAAVSSASGKQPKQVPEIVPVTSKKRKAKDFNDSKVKSINGNTNVLQIVCVNGNEDHAPVALSNGKSSHQKKVAKEQPAVGMPPTVGAPGSTPGRRLKSQTNRYFTEDGASEKRKQNSRMVVLDSFSDDGTPQMIKKGRGKGGAGYLPLICDNPPAAVAKVEKVKPMVQFEKVSPSTPAFFRVAHKKVLPKSSPSTKAQPRVAKETPMQLSKKVNFLLSKNVAHADGEYLCSVKNSPSVPFDAGRTPSQGVLKVKGNQTPKLNISVARRKAMDFF